MVSPSLAEFLVDENRNVWNRGLIATVYGRLAAQDPAAFDWLEQQLEEPLIEGATQK